MSKVSIKHKIEVPIGALLNTKELGTAIALQASEHKEVNPKDSQHWFWTSLSLQIPEKIVSQSTDILENFTSADGLITSAFTSHISWTYNSTQHSATGASGPQTENH